MTPGSGWRYSLTGYAGKAGSAMMKRFALVLVVVALVPTAAFAQGRQGGGRTRGGGRATAVVWNAHATLLLFEAVLELTDAQARQLDTVFSAAEETAAPVATALEAGKNALFEAVKAGRHDDELQKLAERHGDLAIQLQALQARTFARLWALLTAEQKTKVDQSTYEHIGTFLANAARPGGH
jgi:Spy/CpxP family protein refolding chaperone